MPFMFVSGSSIRRIVGCVALVAAVIASSARAAVSVGDGAKRQVVADGATLTIDPPELKEMSLKVSVPPNFDKYMPNYDTWANATSLAPKRDEQGTLILGALYRMIQPETVAVKSADGKRSFVVEKDYKLNETWGTIANLKNALGDPKAKEELSVSYTVALQRIDLVQADASGKAVLKRGKSALLCPERPEPDVGCKALAGVYVAPWKRDGAWTVTAEDLFPISDVEPVKPIGAEHLSKAMEKLKGGQELKIAFLGDSVTLGAEAPQWFANLWEEKNKSYASQVVVGLRKRFPKATLTPIAAFKGGTTTAAAPKMMEESVLPGKADVLVIAFGLNDANGPIGKGPSMEPAAYKENIRKLITTAKGAGMEVILVTPLQPNPWMKNDFAKRIPDYRKALLELAAEEKVSAADVYLVWMQQAQRGVPPFSMLHNWINHPGVAGHRLYADTILALFPKE